MRRRYTADDFRRALALIRRHVPDAAVTTDVMVGFPGETEADFEATYRLCQEIGFAAIHVFPYSRRPGTAAALMREQTPPAIKRDRLEQMLALARVSAEAFRARFEGRTMAVLWEEARRRGARTVWQGLTGNYLRVYTDAGKPFEPAGAQDLTNRILPTRLTGAAAAGLLGVLG
jgi:threonylcarbamoyladenosine tRNA methylthiotransferase MtaB